MATRRHERNLLIDHLMALSGAELHGLRRRWRLPSAQCKAELREVLCKAIGNGTLTTDAIVDFLDEVTPWGKQHVILYRGPKDSAKNWRDSAWVKVTLKQHDLSTLLGKRLPLVLPKELTLASIQSLSSTLRVTAIRRREGWVRDYTLIKRGKTTDGRELEYRGYVRQVLRGLVAFEWNLVANEAMLQISQLPTGGSYSGVAAEFSNRVASWLALDTFTTVDIRRAIGKLHKLETSGTPKATSRALGLDRLGSRRMTFRSTSSKIPLHGDKALDKFIDDSMPNCIPRISDFDWGPAGAGDGGDHAGAKRTHFAMVGNEKRINFMTPNSEKRIRDVLAELRRLSK